MDYKNIYTLKYNETRETIKHKFLESLKNGNTEGFAFIKLYSTLKEDIKTKINGLNIEYFENDYDKVLEVFNESHLTYNSENLLNTLNNETFEKFNEIVKKTSLKYEVFVGIVAHYKSFKDALKIMNNNYRLYDIMYQANDFKNFTFEFIEGKIMDSEIFKNEYNRLYPIAKIVQLVFKDNEYGRMELVLPEIIKNNKNIDKKNKGSKIHYNLTKFTEDEKILLMHIYLNNSGIPKTELLKASRLAQIDDVSFFKKCDSGNTTYNKFSKGLSYYEDNNTKRKIIDGLIENIDGFGLKKISEVLKIERRRIK